jgi:hypothetical protein
LTGYRPLILGRGRISFTFVAYALAHILSVVWADFDDGDPGYSPGNYASIHVKGIVESSIDRDFTVFSDLLPANAGFRFNIVIDRSAISGFSCTLHFWTIGY